MSDKNVRGPKGDRGSPGSHGHQGEIGNPGQRGAKGRQGIQGKPGRLTGNPDSHMGKVYLAGHSRGTWALAAYLLLASTIAFGFYQQAQATKRAEQASVDADFRTCLAGNGLREQVRNLVIVATAAGGVDYSKIEGYDKLDKSMQDYLSSIAQRSSGVSDFREKGLAALKDRDCEQLFPDHSKDAGNLPDPRIPSDPRKP